MAKVKRPIGVICTSVYFFIFAVVLILFAVFSIALANTFINVARVSNGTNIGISLEIVVVSSVSFLLSVLHIVLGIFLLRGNSWARKTSITMSSLLILGGIVLGITQGWLNAFFIVVHVIILHYLLFNSNAKEFFESA